MRSRIAHTLDPILDLDNRRSDEAVGDHSASPHGVCESGRMQSLAFRRWPPRLIVLSDAE